MDLLKSIGLLTWAIIAIPYATTHPPIVAVVAWLLFGVLFWFSARLSGMARFASLAAQTLLALGIISLDMRGLLPVLLVIVAAQVGMCFRLPQAIAWIVVQSVVMLAIVMRVARSDSALTITFGYFAFQMFGVVTAHIADRETHARQDLARVNAELRVATSLLDISSRASERLRISRDLHDLLGHHLTALSLNLEVARNLTSGDAREHVERGQTIARELLRDLRSVVSRLRDDEPVDLAASIASIRQTVTAPAIHLAMPEHLSISDSAVAEVALRCVQEIVTNAVRHSSANNLWIEVAKENGALRIDARDDGTGAAALLPGNGLRGMRERIEALGGTLAIETARGRGFNVRSTLPLA